MYRLTFLALFCFCASGVFADVPEFEKPIAGLKTKTTESYDKDDKDPAVERFTVKVVEKFDDRGDLVSKETSDADGKAEQFVDGCENHFLLSHAYGALAESVCERAAVHATGAMDPDTARTRGPGGRLGNILARRIW